MGILVKPGKSIIVKFGQLDEYMFNIIALSTMFLFFPQTLSVSSSIDYLTLEKSTIFYFGNY